MFCGKIKDWDSNVVSVHLNKLTSRLPPECGKSWEKSVPGESRLVAAPKRIARAKIFICVTVVMGNEDCILKFDWLWVRAPPVGRLVNTNI